MHSSCKNRWKEKWFWNKLTCKKCRGDTIVAMLVSVISFMQFLQEDGQNYLDFWPNMNILKEILIFVNRLNDGSKKCHWNLSANVAFLRKVVQKNMTLFIGIFCFEEARPIGIFFYEILCFSISCPIFTSSSFILFMWYNNLLSVFWCYLFCLICFWSCPNTRPFYLKLIDIFLLI